MIKHPNIINNNYSVVHYDSPDNRGIDVALLYQSNNFDFQESKKFKVKLIDDDGKKGRTQTGGDNGFQTASSRRMGSEADDEVVYKVETYVFISTNVYL